jgi:ribosomal protein S18 acetylase RimI-like enzyme
MGLTRTFRRAAAGDAGLIVAFETEVTNRKLYGRPLDHEAALSEIGGNQCHLLFVDERLVATGAFRWREDASVYLSNIAVLPGMRRQGLGREMLNHLLSFCADADTVDLAVHPDNLPAIALYTAARFSPIYVKDDFFGDGEPRLIMRRSRSIRRPD